MRTWCLTLTVVVAALLVPSAAEARSEKTFDWSYSAVWSSAIRLIRADRGYTIKDKDRDNGYILFVYPGDGAVKQCGASLEIFEATDEHGKRVRVRLTIEHQPSYVELQLLDALERKLQDEQGAPPRKQPPKPKEPPKEPAPSE